MEIYHRTKKRQGGEFTNKEKRSGGDEKQTKTKPGERWKVEEEIKWQKMKQESRVEGARAGHCRVMAYNSHSLFYEPLLIEA